MKNKLERKLWAVIARRIRSRYPLIIVKPKVGMFNHECYNNAVQFSRDHKNYKIFEVMYLDRGRPILHYVNEKDGIYFETTLGYTAEKLEYYVIRKIHPSDYDRLRFEFDNSIDSWNDEFLKWYHKLFLIDRCV